MSLTSERASNLKEEFFQTTPDSVRWQQAQTNKEAMPYMSQNSSSKRKFLELTDLIWNLLQSCVITTYFIPGAKLDVISQ